MKLTVIRKLRPLNAPSKRSQTTARRPIDRNPHSVHDCPLSAETAETCSRKTAALASRCYERRKVESAEGSNPLSDVDSTTYIATDDPRVPEGYSKSCQS